jgi:uncharacterized protein (DUF2141 family)
MLSHRRYSAGPLADAGDTMSDRPTVSALTLVLIASISVPAQQPRDRPRPTRVGPATIAGVVVSDETSPKPLRRARVMLGSPSLPIGRTLITHDDGTFAFEGLPAGRYTLSAAKEGYIGMGHGAARPGRRGSPIIVDGGALVRLVLKLPRGSVITGSVSSRDGQPMAGVSVSALANRYLPNSGERRLTTLRISPTLTDDRGVYRLYGLEAGEYAVAAYIQSSPGTTGDVQALSDADIRSALEGSSPPPPRTVTLVPVFFPGTPVAGQATMVTVGTGEERTGVDIQFLYAPTARIEGTVFSPRPEGVSLSLSSPITTRTPGIATGFSVQKRADADGRFSISGVPPGHHTLSASSRIQAVSSDTAPTTLSASTELGVDGEDVSGLVLTLTPGVRIGGQVVFDGAEPPADVATMSVHVPLTNWDSQSAHGPIPPLRLDSIGRFVVEGLAPATYRPGVNVPGLRTPIGRWWLTSIVIGGREALDAPLDLRQSADDVVVTLSDRASALSGIVRDARGDPVGDAWVVVFTTHPGAWFQNSRRVAAVKTGADGRYSIRNLPAGEYHLATVFDLEQGEWFDSVLLRELAAGAVRIAIADNEQKAVDPVFR